MVKSLTSFYFIDFLKLHENVLQNVLTLAISLKFPHGEI